VSPRSSIVLVTASRASRVRWELTSATGGDASGCARLLDTLDTLPRPAWLALGRDVATADAATIEGWTAARAALDVVLDRRRLAVTAWLVGDAIETALPLALRRGSPPEPAAERAWAALARRAATDAALARLVRPWLAPQHVATLLAPIDRTDLARGRHKEAARTWRPRPCADPGGLACPTRSPRD
jgi:hypothetical protein